jgi:TRAP-type C4-dicarboxylate transport system substrate-binding protein
MTELRLVAGVGATIMSKHRWNGLSDQHKRLLREVAKKHHEQLVLRIRERNEESIRILKEQGIEVIPVPHQEELKWRRVAEQLQNRFAGQLYKKDLLDEIRKSLGECCKSK